MSASQAGILQPVPKVARHLIFTHSLESDPVEQLRRLQDVADGDSIVVGLGQSLLLHLGCDVKGMQDMPALSGSSVEIPSTPASLWIWLRGEDRGDLVVQTLALKQRLAGAFELRDAVDCFMHHDSRDLTGYEDGTENPEGEDAERAALVSSGIEGLDGSSFASIQQWLHNLSHFQALPQTEQDNIFGRHRDTNEEFDSAPESAHVKRSAQESFTPEAFMLRRSMPWNNATQEGLVFLSFGHSLAAFDAIMRRMVGLEDGITDGLFRFTRPVNGAYFWCPPMKDGKLNLSLLKIS
ncbi:MAG: Dyp-type peroxidase [Ketobacter sp.]|nr:Dyp-type peroxidase [Ketobacter sp.]